MFTLCEPHSARYLTGASYLSPVFGSGTERASRFSIELWRSFAKSVVWPMAFLAVFFTVFVLVVVRLTGLRDLLELVTGALIFVFTNWITSFGSILNCLISAGGGFHPLLSALF